MFITEPMIRESAKRPPSSRSLEAVMPSHGLLEAPTGNDGGRPDQRRASV
jgi:hypothetical protein